MSDFSVTCPHGIGNHQVAAGDSYVAQRRRSRHNIDRDEWKIRAHEFCARGNRLPHAKLTPELAISIRAEHVLNSRTHGAPALARKHRLHRRTIEKVLSYETWGTV